MFYLYKVTNSVNDKVYIGRTVNPQMRWWQHKSEVRCGSTKILHNAMRAYGMEKFTFVTIAEFETLEDVKANEILVIAQHQSGDRAYGYNLSPGGEDVETAIARSMAVWKARREADPEGEASKWGVLMRNMQAALGEDRRRQIARDRWAAKTAEQRRDFIRKGLETKGEEGLKSIGRKAAATRALTGIGPIAAQKALVTLGPDGLARRAEKTQAALAKHTPAEKKAARLKALATMGEDGIRARAQKTQAALRAKSAEEKREIGLRRWETRRFNATVEALLGGM